MSSSTIDTLVLFDRLKKSFTEEQAHAISEIIKEVRDENMNASATKADLKLAIEELRNELTKEMKELELRITLRFGVMIAASIAITVSLIKLL